MSETSAHREISNCSGLYYRRQLLLASVDATDLTMDRFMRNCSHMARIRCYYNKLSKPKRNTWRPREILHGMSYVPDIAKCNTEHGLTQLSTGLAVMSLSAVPKILKTPNTSNFPNDSAEQHKLASASASALRGTESQVASATSSPGGPLVTSLPQLKVLCRCYGSLVPEVF